jgi:hypothetical protein
MALTRIGEGNTSRDSRLHGRAAANRPVPLMMGLQDWRSAVMSAVAVKACWIYRRLRQETHKRCELTLCWGVPAQTWRNVLPISRLKRLSTLATEMQE